jgi:hypothetical protein
LRSYLNAWAREKASWESDDGIGKGSVRAHEKKLFFLRDMADSLRLMAGREALENFDLVLNFDDEE